ncbi:MAG TPA: outer membrane lipid asymmetry maintenance protein MlaD [Alphaproteobacteria bacterium]|nr:outer membrane lipid asymmetry maintenance protein MlaD [Rhodospirillaceae bacterium]HRJ12000.1 outer membrane lipid asymmetry maintenance protein MlaD [Alphaproteobacteria bacterium]
MNRNVLETALGAIVLVTAILFLALALNTANATRPSGYKLKASFTKIDGVNVGADVRVSGIKAGTVSAMTLDDNYRAILTMDIDNSVKIPSDSAAVIASGGLLGDKFIAIEPGGEEEMLKDGAVITMTQSPPGLEQLLGQVIFSINKQSDNKAAEPAAASPAAMTIPASPATTAVTAPAADAPSE